MYKEFKSHNFVTDNTANFAKAFSCCGGNIVIDPETAVDEELKKMTMKQRRRTKEVDYIQLLVRA